MRRKNLGIKGRTILPEGVVDEAHRLYTRNLAGLVFFHHLGCSLGAES